MTLSQHAHRKQVAHGQTFSSTQCYWHTCSSGTRERRELRIAYALSGNDGSILLYRMSLELREVRHVACH